ncbi:MAG: exosortase system-associated protein, TIGR04073 family [Candidatus Omnitrophota bacterium]|nr:exosortase system-associated protein, TIGR04073 family [Candidatus Omnitrophota bacterium]
MMKKHLLIYFFSILLIFSLSLNARAEDGPFNKLGRGAANVLTGWTDGFNTVGDHWNKNQSVPEAIAGIPEGMVKAGLRTAIGLYEALTFSVPIPKGYRPIVSPKYAEPSASSPERVVTLRKRP